MTFPQLITKVAFAGDWHDNWKYMLNACYWAHQKGAQAIVHVGDFGFWSNGAKYDELNSRLEKWDMYLLFIDGNHENFPLLNSILVNDEGYREIRSRIIHLPRGFRWEWYGKIFTALGGARSIDKGWREEGVDWFSEEDITVDDMKKVIDGGYTDFLITHDAPQSAKVPLDPEFARSFAYKDVFSCELSRYMLEKVCTEIAPMYVIHGHYHVRYDSFHIWCKSYKSQIHGLHCDGNPFPLNMTIVDLTELTGYIDA